MAIFTLKEKEVSLTNKLFFASGERLPLGLIDSAWGGTRFCNSTNREWRIDGLQSKWWFYFWLFVEANLQGGSLVNIWRPCKLWRWGWDHWGQPSGEIGIAVLGTLKREIKPNTFYIRRIQTRTCGTPWLHRCADSISMVSSGIRWHNRHPCFLTLYFMDDRFRVKQIVILNGTSTTVPFRLW